MAKTEEYRKRYYDWWHRVSRDVGNPGTTSESIARFLEKSDGPVFSAFLEQDLLKDYDTGEVNKDNTKAAAEKLARDQSYADTKQGREEVIAAVKSREGGKISDEEAREIANKEKAAQATAVLSAAAAGRVSLTKAQRDRLEVMAQGDYIEYQSSNRGAGTRSSKSYEQRIMQEERAREFRQEIRKRGSRAA